MTIDLTADREDLQQMILDLATRSGCPMSRSRAGKLARKVRRGDFDSNLERLLRLDPMWRQDPTGEEATNEVMKTAA